MFCNFLSSRMGGLLFSHLKTTHFWSWWTMFNFSFQSFSLLELINIFLPCVNLLRDKDEWTFPKNPPFKALHKAC
jgi:hypothetical protein